MTASRLPDCYPGGTPPLPQISACTPCGLDSTGGQEAISRDGSEKRLYIEAVGNQCQLTAGSETAECGETVSATAAGMGREAPRDRVCPACGFAGHTTPSCMFSLPTSKAQRSTVEYLTTNRTARMVAAANGISIESVRQAVRVRTEARVSTLRQMTARIVDRMRSVP